MADSDRNFTAFSDLVEGGRSLQIQVREGMVKLDINGGRDETSFLLDSEDVPEFAREVFRAALHVQNRGVVKHGGS